MRQLIRTNGTVENLPGPVNVKEIRHLIGAVSLDTVSLVDRVHVMLVDDLGHAKNLPINDKASVLYWQKCGKPNQHVIRGDVVIVPDEDFA